LYTVKLSFTFEGEEKSPSNDKKKIKRIHHYQPRLQKILKGILHIEDEDK
jgi:hypothetical protein